MCAGWALLAQHRALEADAGYLLVTLSVWAPGLVLAALSMAPGPALRAAWSVRGTLMQLYAGKVLLCTGLALILWGADVWWHLLFYAACLVSGVVLIAHGLRRITRPNAGFRQP